MEGWEFLIPIAAGVFLLWFGILNPRNILPKRWERVLFVATGAAAILVTAWEIFRG